MENATYATLTRQSGLMREMQVVANNIANSATTGFRAEGVTFAEVIRRTREGPSLSMAAARVRTTSELQGGLRKTGAPLDLAIEGRGYFLIETPEGERLTRAGSFSASGAGDLVTADGHRVLDAGGAPVFIPPDAGDLAIAADGTVSAQGRPLTQIGLVRPADPLSLVREGGVMFRTEGGIEPEEDGRILQGYLEASNVDSVTQIARMIEVQRAYELGQSFLDAEDERIRNAVKTLVR